MTNSQFAMQNGQSGKDWDKQELISLAARQSTGVNWRQAVDQQIILSGVVKSGSINSDWQWHYAKARANNQSQVCFDVSAGMTCGLVYEGELDLQVGGSAHCLKPEKPLAFCFANAAPVPVKRRFKAGALVHKFTLNIGQAWLSAMNLKPYIRYDKVRLVTFAASEEFIDAAWAISNEPEPQSFKGKIQQMTWVNTLLEAAAEALGEQIDSRQGAASQASLPLEQRLIERVRAIIQSENILLEDIHLDELARSLGASISGIQRLAKKCFGQSLLKHIRQAKLANALTAMKERNLTIGEAAFFAGYKQSSNFSLAFRKAYGLPPGVILKAQ